eukprot:jgi/Psemu1/303904/fgenesh1_kg.128_\
MSSYRYVPVPVLFYSINSQSTTIFLSPKRNISKDGRNRNERLTHQRDTSQAGMRDECILRFTCIEIVDPWAEIERSCFHWDDILRVILPILSVYHRVRGTSIKNTVHNNTNLRVSARSLVPYRF